MPEIDGTENVEVIEPDMGGDASLDPGTFNFIDELEGATYSEDEISIYTDEKAAYQLDQTLAILSDYKLKNRTIQEGGKWGYDDYAQAEIVKLEKLAAEFEAALKRKTYKFHLRGVNLDMMEHIETDAEAKFPTRNKTIPGPNGRNQVIPIPNPEKYAYIGDATIALYVTMIEDSFGRRDIAPGIETIQLFRRKASPSQYAKLSRKIRDLQDKDRAREEQIDEGFLANI